MRLVLIALAMFGAASAEAATKPTKFDLTCTHNRVGNVATFWVDLDRKRICEERRCDASMPWKPLKVEARTLTLVQPQAVGRSSIWRFDRVNSTAIWELDGVEIGPWNCRMDRYTGPGAETAF